MWSLSQWHYWPIAKSGPDWKAPDSADHVAFATLPIIIRL